MNSNVSPATRFIQAVHRRMAIITLIEQLGLALLAASLLAILLLLIGIHQSMPTLPILLSTASLGLIGGLVSAIYRWPTRRAAAAEADQQLRLDDLLSTAIALSSTDADFAEAMLAMADARCASHVPSDVLLRKFGIGSWSAVAMAMSAAAILAVIPFGSSRSPAIDANSSVLTATSTEPHDATQSTGSPNSIARNNDPISEASTNISAPVSSTPASPGEGSGESGDNLAHRSASSTVGGGSATNTAKPTAAQSLSSAKHRPDQAGTTAGGGASTTSATQHRETATGIIVSNTADARATPWNPNPASTLSTVEPRSPTNDPAIPPEYRDLVRDFFNRR